MSRRGLCTCPALASLLKGDGSAAAGLPDAETYLTACGIPVADMEQLQVAWPKEGVILGKDKRVYKKSVDKFLQIEPDVKFGAKYGRCTLVMLDPDAPSPNADGKTPGELGPILHWLDTGVLIKPRASQGGLQMNGAAEVAYAGPAPPAGTHRYIQVLFQEKGTPTILGTEERRTNWDFAKFVKVNAETLKPVAYNYFLTSSD